MTRFMRKLDKGYISLSFDDGREDNYINAYPILKEHNLPATFNIAMAYVEGKMNNTQIFGMPPMTLTMLNEMAKNELFEIAGHGYWHLNTKEDILEGINALNSFLEKNQLTKHGNGFASPGSDLTIENYLSIKEDLDLANIQYVRISSRFSKFSKIKLLLRKANRILHIPFIYRFVYQDTLMDCSDNQILWSIPILSSITYQEIISIIDLAIKEKKACVLMFHSIIDGKSIKDNWSYSTEQFNRICIYLSRKRKEGILDVLTSMDMYHLLSGKS